MENKIHIGIDGGATTGIAIWDGKYLKLESGSFWDMAYFLEKKIFDDIKKKKIPFVIYIEDTSSVKITWRRKNSNNSIGTNDRMARNVGMNIRDCQLWCEWCEINKFEYKKVRPLKKSWNTSNGKISNDEFKKLTNYHEQTNQHERDAGLIVISFIKLK